MISVDLDLIAICKALGIHSNPWQDAVLESLARHVMMRAARRTGKSYNIAKRSLKYVLLENTRGWIVGPTYDLAHKEFRYILDFVRLWCQLTKNPPPVQIRDTPQSGDLYIKTSWGSEVIGKSAAKAETLVGEELDWVAMVEAALHKEETWERYIRPTLITRKGESMWAYTPDSAGMWLYELEQKAKTRPDWQLFTLPAWECPHYDTHEIEAARRDMDEEKFAEQIGGDWRFYTGRVYKMVQRASHFVDPFPIPATWRIYAGVDFGLRDPTACIWLAKSPTGEAYLIDEYYRSERSSEEHIQSMREIEAKRGYRVTARVADHHGLGGQLILNARRQGFHTIASMSHDKRNKRERSINAMTRKLRPHPYHMREFEHSTLKGVEGALYPDVFIFKDRCPELKKELEFFRWRDSKAKEGAASATDGEDHAIDAMEYVIEYLNLGIVMPRRDRAPRTVKIYQREQNLSAGHTGYYYG